MRRSSLSLIIAVSLACKAVCAQPHQAPALPTGPTQQEIGEALAQVQVGDFKHGATGALVKGHVVESIPLLQAQFTKLTDPEEKSYVAAALVMLGDKDDVYWNYLAELVTPAIESTEPYPRKFNKKGEEMSEPPGSFSDEFLAWVKSHNVSPLKAVQDALFIWPGRLTTLYLTRDPRAIPLLRKALTSPNYALRSVAAMGLATNQDAASIPLIVDSCKGTPKGDQIVFALALISFRDPRGRQAAEPFLTPEMKKSLPPAQQ